MCIRERCGVIATPAARVHGSRAPPLLTLLPSSRTPNTTPLQLRRQHRGQHDARCGLRAWCAGPSAEQLTCTVLGVLPAYQKVIFFVPGTVSVLPPGHVNFTATLTAASSIRNSAGLVPSLTADVSHVTVNYADVSVSVFAVFATAVPEVPAGGTLRFQVDVNNNVRGWVRVPVGRLVLLPVSAESQTNTGSM